MSYAGSIAIRGRAKGVAVATGTATAVGQLALDVLGTAGGRPPLLERMERFTRAIAVTVLVAAVVIGLIGVFFRGHSAGEMFLYAVALAVSAIPEGLPVALTVALAIATNRMAARGVIVRQLAAVEGLGSCTTDRQRQDGHAYLQRVDGAARSDLPTAWSWRSRGRASHPTARCSSAAALSVRPNPSGWSPWRRPPSSATRPTCTAATAAGSGAAIPPTWHCWRWPTSSAGAGRRRWSGIRRSTRSPSSRSTSSRQPITASMARSAPSSRGHRSACWRCASRPWRRVRTRSCSRRPRRWPDGATACWRWRTAPSPRRSIRKQPRPSRRGWRSWASSA